MIILNRHKRVAYLLMLIMPITLSIAVAATISGFAYINGGMSSVYKAWTEKPPMDKGYPLAALAIGVPIGIVSGYQVWIWLIKKFHLLTEEEFAKYKDEKRSN